MLGLQEVGDGWKMGREGSGQVCSVEPDDKGFLRPIPIQIFGNLKIRHSDIYRLIYFFLSRNE